MGLKLRIQVSQRRQLNVVYKELPFEACVRNGLQNLYFHDCKNNHHSLKYSEHFSLRHLTNLYTFSPVPEFHYDIRIIMETTSWCTLTLITIIYSVVESSNLSVIVIDQQQNSNLLAKLQLVGEYQCSNYHCLWKLFFTSGNQLVYHH